MAADTHASIKPLSEHVKFPQVRVLLYYLPDETFLADAIDAGAIGNSKDPDETIVMLIEALAALHECAVEDSIPMTFAPRADDLALFEEFSKGDRQPVRLADGRMLLNAFVAGKRVGGRKLAGV